MPIATHKKINPKRQGNHHRQSKKYKQVYWPYLPLLAISVFMLIFSLVPYQRGKTLAYAVEMSRETLLQVTNSSRQQYGRSTLRLNNELNAAAQAKASDMSAKNYWSHKTPEGDDPWVFIDNAGYTYSKAGENLAYGFKDSSTTVNGWMKSPSHRDNLLDSQFLDVGFGYANIADYQQNGPGTVVVAMYGRPQTMPVTTTADNLPTNFATNPDQPVRAITKAEALTGNRLPWLSFAIGLASGGAVMLLFINHGLRLRKLFIKSEKYFVAHPLLDVSLVLLIVSALELSTTVGYIH